MYKTLFFKPTTLRPFKVPTLSKTNRQTQPTKWSFTSLLHLSPQKVGPALVILNQSHHQGRTRSATPDWFYSQLNNTDHNTNRFSTACSQIIRFVIKVTASRNAGPFLCAVLCEYWWRCERTSGEDASLQMGDCHQGLSETVKIIRQVMRQVMR